MRSLTNIPVRYAETDKMGIVYHANYLLYFDEARTDFLSKIGFPWTEMEKRGYFAPVITAYLDYGRPVTYGDEVIVRTRIFKLTATRVYYGYEVFKKDQDIDTEKPCMTGWTSHCLTEAATGRPVSMKKSTPDFFQRYQEVLEPEEQKSFSKRQR